MNYHFAKILLTMSALTLAKTDLYAQEPTHSTNTHSVEISEKESRAPTVGEISLLEKTFGKAIVKKISFQIHKGLAIEHDSLGNPIIEKNVLGQCSIDPKTGKATLCMAPELYEDDYSFHGATEHPEGLTTFFHEYGHAVLDKFKIPHAGGMAVGYTANDSAGIKSVYGIDDLAPEMTFSKLNVEQQAEILGKRATLLYDAEQNGLDLTHDIKLSHYNAMIHTVLDLSNSDGDKKRRNPFGKIR